eukprot:1196339-Prorocentrum_minimum.AAC.3
MAGWGAQLMPLMQELTGDAVSTRLGEMVQQSAQLRDWLDAQPDAFEADARWGGGGVMDLDKWAQLPPMVRTDQLNKLISGDTRDTRVTLDTLLCDTCERSTAYCMTHV